MVYKDDLGLFYDTQVEISQHVTVGMLRYWVGKLEMHEGEYQLRAYGNEWHGDEWIPIRGGYLLRFDDHVFVIGERSGEKRF